MINEHKINIDELKEYEQKTLEKLDSKLEKQNPNIKIHLTKFENINIYLLESSTYMSDKILVVEAHKNLIKKVELMSSTSIDEVIKYCSKKI